MIYQNFIYIVGRLAREMEIIWRWRRRKRAHGEDDNSNEEQWPN